MKRWIAVALTLGCAAGPIRAGNYYVSGLDQYGAPPNCGTDGQLLTSNGNCGTTWSTVSTPSDVAYTDVNNSFSAVQTFPTGTASAPGISVGETNTGFYNSGSHTLIYSANGAARLNLDANGVGNFNNSSASGLFFSGSDTTVNSGNGLVKIVNGNTGASPFQVDTGSAKLTTISGAGGLSVTYNVSVGSFTVTGAGAPPDSQALCLLSGQLGHCTTVVGATGGCTCSVP